ASAFGDRVFFRGGFPADDIARGRSEEPLRLDLNPRFPGALYAIAVDPVAVAFDQNPDMFRIGDRVAVHNAASVARATEVNTDRGSWQTCPCETFADRVGSDHSFPS